ncbi:hypothetical protein Q4554_14765 [Leptospira santarosai]|uniref:hypothetical protein n=1 Tax=Leptospira santarosai TaxID=28183 RepID=UPI0026E4552D|nr:hypothetical protein [Leptospira santarosai]MDO6395340.1 hypothetical protein [Leptospira santarosai]
MKNITKLFLLGIYLQIILNCKQSGNSNEELLSLLLTAQIAANCSTPEFKGDNISLKFTPYTSRINQYMGSLGFLSNFEFGRRIEMDMKESLPVQYTIRFYNANSPCDVPQDYSKFLSSYNLFSPRINKKTVYATPLSGNLMALASSYGSSNTSPTDITLSIESSSVCKSPTIADATLRNLPFNYKIPSSLTAIKIDSYLPSQQIVFTSNVTNIGSGSLQIVVVPGTDACYPSTYKTISFNQNTQNQNQVNWNSSTASGPLVILAQYFSETLNTAPNDIKIQVQ